MIALQTSIGIERPIEDVFAYVSDPRNLPAWNSAVQAVRPTSPASHSLDSTFSMRRQLPTGPVTNQLEVIARQPPRDFAIRTTTGPTPFLTATNSLPSTARPRSGSTHRSSSTESPPTCRSSHDPRSRKGSTTTS